MHQTQHNYNSDMTQTPSTSQPGPARDWLFPSICSSTPHLIVLILTSLMVFYHVALSSFTFTGLQVSSHQWSQTVTSHRLSVTSHRLLSHPIVYPSCLIAYCYCVYCRGLSSAGFWSGCSRADIHARVCGSGVAGFPSRIDCTCRREWIIVWQMIYKFGVLKQVCLIRPITWCKS